MSTATVAPDSMPRTMEPFELAWVVGFLEGRFVTYETPSKSNAENIAVQARQVQREPLERLQQYTGLGTISLLKTQRRYYVWRIMYGPAAVAFMRLIQPHCTTKRQVQIDRCLEAYEHQLSIEEA
jgi:hypothetical protein